MNHRIIRSCLSLLIPLGASAAEYTRVLNEKTAIHFSYRQMGVGMKGSFQKSTTRLAFDPANAAQTSVTLDVDLGSVDTGFAESDHELAGKAWFNTSVYPTARFVTTAVKSLGGNRYELTGQLTIKGHTRQLVVPATFSIAGQQGLFDGSFLLERADFGIGDGEWAAYDIVANAVQITFHLVALPAP